VIAGASLLLNLQNNYILHNIKYIKEVEAVHLKWLPRCMNLSSFLFIKSFLCIVNCFTIHETNDNVLRDLISLHYELISFFSPLVISSLINQIIHQETKGIPKMFMNNNELVEKHGTWKKLVSTHPKLFIV